MFDDLLNRLIGVKLREKVNAGKVNPCAVFKLPQQPSELIAVPTADVAWV